MSDRRLRQDVEVYGFLDPDLEVVLRARNLLSDPEKWIQGHLGKGQRKCLAGHLLNAGARIGDGLNRMAVKLGFACCSEMVEFNDTHTHAGWTKEFAPGFCWPYRTENWSGRQGLRVRLERAENNSPNSQNSPSSASPTLRTALSAQLPKVSKHRIWLYSGSPSSITLVLRCFRIGVLLDY